MGGKKKIYIFKDALSVTGKSFKYQVFKSHTIFFSYFCYFSLILIFLLFFFLHIANANRVKHNFENVITFSIKKKFLNAFFSIDEGKENIKKNLLLLVMMTFYNTQTNTKNFLFISSIKK